MSAHPPREPLAAPVKASLPRSDARAAARRETRRSAATAPSITNADKLQDYLAGRLSIHDHNGVELAMARDSGAARRAELLRNTAALLRQGADGPMQIPAEWVELLDRLVRGDAKH